MNEDTDKSGLLKDSGLDILDKLDDFDRFKVRILRPGITAVLGDCQDWLELCGENAYGLLLDDPPYGIGEDGGKQRTRGKKTTNGKKKNWDKEAPTATYFSKAIKATENQIIWGANHFIERCAINSPCWIAWDKKDDGSDFADFELAFTSFSTSCKIFRFQRQASQGKPGKPRIHPTQKPRQLYSWIYYNYVESGTTIVDFHGGSGSSAIEAYYANCPIVIIEKDPEYFETMCKRILRETAQADLFKPHTAQPIAKQGDLFNQDSQQTKQ